MLRAHPQASPDLVHVHADIVAVDKGRTGCRRKQPGQDGHRGGFASAIVTKERRDLTFIQV